MIVPDMPGSDALRAFRPDNVALAGARHEAGAVGRDAADFGEVMRRQAPCRLPASMTTSELPCGEDTATVPAAGFAATEPT